MLHRKALSASITLALLFTLILTGVAIPAAQPAQAQDNQPEETRELFTPFWQAWDLLHSNYVDPLDDHAMATGALTGMLQAVNDPLFDFPIPTLDPDAGSTDELFTPFWETWILLHEEFDNLDDVALFDGAMVGLMESFGDSNMDYFTPEEWARLNENQTGEYEGIGALVDQDEITGALTLVSVFDGSPAETAGLQPGDQIVQVEGQDITGLSQEEIISRVRGPAGTLVRLGVIRPDEENMLKFEVVRGRITTPSVTFELLDDGIGYVRLSRFIATSTADLEAALRDLDANNLNGLVFDMRNNPGGYKSTSIEIASAFIEEGIILIERGPDYEQPSYALGNAVAPDVPLVVLVDQASASASELVAGALRDNERATIVGMPTFGKGSVQIWAHLLHGGGIRITISRWYTPNGDSVTDVGIIPDIEVPYEPFEISGDEDNQLTAAIQVLQGTYEPPADTDLEGAELDPDASDTGDSNSGE